MLVGHRKDRHPDVAIYDNVMETRSGSFIKMSLAQKGKCSMASPVDFKNKAQTAWQE